MNPKHIINNEMLERAILFATKEHAGITRKGDGRPYILHPISVAKRVFDNIPTKTLLKAVVAVLHDVPEDVYEHDIAEGIAIIREEFGDEVADLVAELTLDKAKYKELGKKEYLLLEMNNMTDDAFDVKLCDRLDNVSEMENMDSDWQIYYAKQTQYVFDNLVRTFTDTHTKMVLKIKAVYEQYLIAA